MTLMVFQMAPHPDCMSPFRAVPRRDLRKVTRYDGEEVPLTFLDEPNEQLDREHSHIIHEEGMAPYYAFLYEVRRSSWCCAVAAARGLNAQVVMLYRALCEKRSLEIYAQMLQIYGYIDSN